jgi:hypothetical protein
MGAELPTNRTELRKILRAILAVKQVKNSFENSVLSASRGEC